MYDLSYLEGCSNFREFFLQHMPGFFFHAKCKTINKNEFEIKEIEMFSKDLILFTS